MSPRGLDEAADHRASDVGLGVPLHAEHEPALGQLDRLDQLVGARPRAHQKPIADTIDALMVM